jgi:hypothetical protein
VRPWGKDRNVSGSAVEEKGLNALWVSAAAADSWGRGVSASLGKRSRRPVYRCLYREARWTICKTACGLPSRGKRREMQEKQGNVIQGLQ